MDVNDCFWEISFSSSDASALNDLVPTYDDRDGSLPSDDFSASYAVSLSDEASARRSLRVSVLESREDGVLGRVSAEVWEASLLLSAYLLQTPELFDDLSGGAVLELGCGCGLAGLVALSVALRARSPSPCQVLLTDFDSEALRSIREALSFQEDIRVSPCETGDSIRLERLDWRDYCQRSGGGDAAWLDSGQVGLIIGSALVYSPAHVALADVLRRAVLLQISDRPGFGLFLLRLETLGLRYELEVLDERLLRHTQMFREHRDGHIRTFDMPLSPNFGSLSPSEGGRIRTPLSAFRILIVTKD